MNDPFIKIERTNDLYHAFFVVLVPFIPKFASQDFHNSSANGKSRTELIIERQVRFINDLHNIKYLKEEMSRKYITPETIEVFSPAFELRYIASNGHIQIAFIGKVSNSTSVGARLLALNLWRKFIAHYPLEDPFNYPLTVADEQQTEYILEPISLRNLSGDNILEIRKFEDLNPMVTSPGIMGYYPHRFMPTFDLSAMGRFLETLVQQRQTCVTSIWLRPTQLSKVEIQFMLQRIVEFEPDENKGNEEKINNQSNENYMAVRRNWNTLFKKERYTDISNTFWPIINRRNHLFEFKIQFIGEHEAPIDVMEALGSELLGNTFKEEPRLWRYIQPIKGSLGIAKYNFRYLEYEPWNIHDIWDEINITPEQKTIVRRLNRLVTPTEAAGPFRLPIPPESGYLPGIQVREEPFIAPFSKISATNYIRLGKVMHHGQETSQDFLIPIRDLSLHLLITGATGTGKTNTCMFLLSQLYRKNIPFLVMYPIDKADYRLFMGDPVMYPSLLIYTVGDATTSPFSFNPFHIAKGILLKAHISSLMRCFSASFSMWDPLPAIYRAALYQVYRECGWDTSIGRGGDVNTKTPTMSQFYDILIRTTEQMISDYDDEAKGRIRQSVEIRIRDLLINAGSVVNAEDHAPIDKILKHPTIMELGRIGSQQDIALVMGFITMLLVEELQSRYRELTPVQRQQQELQHVTLIEEAHRIMPAANQSSMSEDLANPAAKGAQDFANMLAEIRGFGEGIFIAEQIPVQLVAGAIGNTNMKVMHRLEDQESFRLFTDILNLNQQQRDFSRGLEQGHVIVRDRYGQPVLVKVESYSECFQNQDVVDDSDQAVKELMEKQGVRIRIPIPREWSAPNKISREIQQPLLGIFTEPDFHKQQIIDLIKYINEDIQNVEQHIFMLMNNMNSLNNIFKNHGKILLLIELMRSSKMTEHPVKIEYNIFDQLLLAFGIKEVAHRVNIISNCEDIILP